MATKLKLFLCTPENGLIDKLIEEWDAQIKEQDVPEEALKNVRNYEGQLRPDNVYGVFALCAIDADGSPCGPYEAFIHINHAFPKSPDPTLRLTWSRIAPRYEWVDDFGAEHGRIFAAIVGNALAMTKADYKSAEMKLYLLNAADRSFARNFSTALTGVEMPFETAIRGNWLHMNWKS